MKLLTNLDLNKNEARNLRLHILGSAPSSPVTGQLYYNSGDNNVYVWNSSAWEDLGASTSYTAGAGLTLTGSTFDVGAGTGLTVAADSVGISAGGVGTTELADLNVTSGKLANGAVIAGKYGAGSLVNADVNASAGITLSKLATDPLARANHTGTQLAATVSDFNTAVRTNRLDQMAAPTAAVSANGQLITNVGTAVSGTDAINKDYADTLKAGFDWKDSVRTATTANITLSGTQTIDGVSVVGGERVLVKNQSTGSQNGIYVVAAGAWSRATDADVSADVTSGLTVWVNEGTTNADTAWSLSTDDPITLATTALAFTQTSGLGQVTAGTGLTKTGNTIDVIGTANRISVAADAVDISSSYVGQSSITTLGTIITGIWTGTDIAVADGGTGSSSAPGARTNLSAAGYYTSATHSSGTTITITQATHGCRAGRGLLVQVQDETSGEVELADPAVASNGDVTVTFAASQSANSKRVTIVG